MLNPFNITISDTSPIFQYSPSPDGPINTSWNATFSGSSDSSWVPEALGIGTSAHRTKLPGASVRLDWIGTAIYLYGDASAGAYTIDLGGTPTTPDVNVPGLLFAQTGLTYGPHSLILRVVQGTSTTSISSAIVTVGIGETGTTIQNTTVNTLTVPLPASDMVLTGTWYELHMTYGIGGPYVPRIATDVGGSALSFPITSASAFYIIGHVNFNHGPYLVTLTPPSDLGPPQTVHYNGSSRWVGLNTIKYLATGLDRTRTYQVDVTNGANLYYDQSQIVIFGVDMSSSSDPNPGSSPTSTGHHSVSAAGIAGGVVGCLLLFLVFLIIFLCLRRQGRKSEVPHRDTSQMDGAMIQHDPSHASPAATSRSNRPVSMALLPSSPNTQDGIPTTELRPPTVDQPLRPNSIMTHVAENIPISSSAPVAIPGVPSGPRGLSPDDARFFNNLYALNVPAADIAAMMETLRADRQSANLNWMDGSSSSAAIPFEPEIVNTAPPRYDFKD